jgi:transcriptional regulator with XRE-family HTH domain
MSHERCTVCNHLDRLAIERDVRTGASSLQIIADRYAISKTALMRHRDRHMVAEPVQPVSKSSAPATIASRQCDQATSVVSALPFRPGDISSSVSSTTSTADAQEVDPLVALTTQQQRVRQSLMLRQRGLTRAQIARALEVSERTITDWWAKAREEQIARLHADSAEGFLADLRTSRELRIAELYHLHDRARDKGDTKTQIAVHKLLDQIDRTAITLAASVGILDGFKPGTLSENQNTNSLLEGARELVKLLSMDPNALADDVTGDDTPHLH